MYASAYTPFGSKEMSKIYELGRLNLKILEKEFGNIQTAETIITQERIQHIIAHHPLDYPFLHTYGKSIISDPDFIIKDLNHTGTIFMIKEIENSNLNIIIRLALETDHQQLKNSVMTFFRIRNRNLKKLIEKNTLLYKKE